MQRANAKASEDVPATGTSKPKKTGWTLKYWLLRSKLYALALIVTVGYLVIGRLNTEDPAWVQVNLPLSSASILVLCLSVAESYLFVRRIRQQNEEMAATRVREEELQQRLAFQRQTILSQITSAMIDRLDTNQVPEEVLAKIGQLFEADIAGMWVVQKGFGRRFSLRGIHGLNTHTASQLQGAEWSLPEFEDPDKKPEQLIVTRAPQGLSPALAAFSEREHIIVAALTPIIRRHEQVGLIGLFYREPFAISSPFAVEMKVLANLVGSALQAEELYRDLIQAQKIESIGTLTSGIAHDFNNVLAAILACASYIKQHTIPSDPNYRYLEATENSAHRGAALTKQLLAFARREAPRQRVIEPNESLEESLQLLERSFDKVILFQRNFSPDVHRIEMDQSQLEQVILNMAVNARDAMSTGGIFSVSTHNLLLRSKDLRPPGFTLPNGDYVIIGFRDTGHGMDEATQRRIFEPFFTTKAAGKGTGLGLSLVMSILKNARGAIRVESAPGRGTLFEVYIPATTKPLPTTQVALEKKRRRGTECILIAEDEEIIREMAQISLESDGYKVIATPDGAAALARYRCDWPTISLVIADMVMPHMSGPELLSEIRKINPDVRIIVSSGHSHELEGQRMMEHGCLAYLQKPYRPDDLNKLVRQILDSGI